MSDAPIKPEDRTVELTVSVTVKTTPDITAARVGELVKSALFTGLGVIYSPDADKIDADSIQVDEERYYARIRWNAVDVTSAAEELGIELTDKEAEEFLESIESCLKDLTSTRGNEAIDTLVRERFSGRIKNKNAQEEMDEPEETVSGEEESTEEVS